MHHNPFSIWMRGGCFYATEHVLDSDQKLNVVLLIALGFIHADYFTRSLQLRNA